MGNGFGGLLDFFGYGAIGTVLLVFLIIGIILAFVLVVVFLPARNRGRYIGAAKWFYDFLNFNKFWISSIIKIIFIVISTVCFAGGLIVLFMEPTIGLILIVYGIIMRLLLELTMLIMSIRDNVSQINDTLNETLRFGRPVPPIQPQYTQPQYTQPQQASKQPTPVPPQVESVQNEDSIKLCPHCNKTNRASVNYCLQCGTKL